MKKWLKRACMRGTAASLAAVLMVPGGVCQQTAFGAQAAVEVDETVYINLDYYGGLDKVNVVKGLNMNGFTEFTDYGSYLDVENMTSGDTPVLGDGTVTWNLSESPEKRFYYKCRMDQGEVTLPWDFNVSYQLNGVPANADELAGVSGIVEIHIEAEPNENALEYYRNNMILMVSVLVDYDECYSVEAEGSQTQNFGDMTAVAFTALPGEEGDFKVRIGSDSFETMGVIMMMIPGTAEDLEHISDLKEAKDTWKEAGDDLYDSMDQMAASVEAMRSGVNQAMSGLSSAEQARQAWSGNKDSILAGNDQVLASLSAVSEQMEIMIPHIQSAKESAEVVHDSMGDIVDTMGDMQDPLRKLNTRLRNIKSDTSSLSGQIPELTALMQQLMALDAQLQASEQAYVTQLGALSDNLELIDEDYYWEDEELEMDLAPSASGSGTAGGGNGGQSTEKDGSADNGEESSTETGESQKETDKSSDDKEQTDGTEQGTIDENPGVGAGDESGEENQDTGNSELTDTQISGDENNNAGNEESEKDSSPADHSGENEASESDGSQTQENENNDSGELPDSGNETGDSDKAESGDENGSSGEGEPSGNGDGGNGTQTGSESENGSSHQTEKSESNSGESSETENQMEVYGYKAPQENPIRLTASISERIVPRVTSAAIPGVTLDTGELVGLLMERKTNLEALSKSSSQVSARLASLMDETSDASKYSAELVDSLDYLIEDLTAMDDSLNQYYPDFQEALDDTKELVNRTTDAMNEGIATMTIIQNTLKDSSDHLDAAAREGIQSSMELLDKSLSILDSTSSMRKAGRTMKDTMDDEWDELDEENRFLFMDPEADKISFTSEKNQSPDTLQIVLRTAEITLDDVDDISDAETEKASGSPLMRMWNVLVQLWKAVTEIFGNL